VVEKAIKHASPKKWTSQEFRINAQIREFDIYNIVVDFGSDVNVLPKSTWELMGRKNLVWSPIHLRMANQKNIIPFGRLESVLIDIEDIRSTAMIEVIDIMDANNPYPKLLGLEWAFENLSVVNLKKRQLVFEQEDLRVISPLDPKDGKRYIETIIGGMGLKGWITSIR